MTDRRATRWIAVLAALIAGGLAAPSAQAATTEPIATVEPGSTTFVDEPAISGDGRVVAFSSDAALLPDDSNAVADVYLRDRQTGGLERVSVDSDEQQAGGDSGGQASVTLDGRFVAFASEAANLVADDTNDAADIFVRDRLTGTTERVSLDSEDGQSLSPVGQPVISADGRYVAFMGFGLVVGEPFSESGRVYLRDRQAGTTEMVSVSDTEVPAQSANSPAISADGSLVAFVSNDDTLAPGNPGADVFVRDRAAGTTELVSLTDTGAPMTGNSSEPSISSDGSRVSFTFEDGTEVPGGDGIAAADVFVRDRPLASTSLVSANAAGAPGNGRSDTSSISGDGLFVAFASAATDLVSQDTNGASDIFLHDLTDGATERASVATDGSHADGESFHPAVDAGGRLVAFGSTATNLVPGGGPGVFVRDRLADVTPPETSVGAGPDGGVVGPSPTFVFASSEPGSSFECSVDGGPFAPCASPATVGPLAPGTHTFAVRAVDASGNPDGTPAVRSFTVQGVPAPELAAAAPPGPAAPPTAPPFVSPAQVLPAPAVGRTVNVGVVEGVVLVRLPGSRRFVRLGADRQIPTASVIDARRGRVRLTSATGRDGAVQTAEFYDGRFVVTQARRPGAVTDLRLTGPLENCGLSRSAADRKVKGRRLWGDGKGRFRTRGRNGSATVRGTIWLVHDRCDRSTLFRVRQGSVRVRDEVRRRTVIVRRGKAYVAQPRRR